MTSDDLNSPERPSPLDFARHERSFGHSLGDSAQRVARGKLMQQLRITTVPLMVMKTLATHLR